MTQDCDIGNADWIRKRSRQIKAAGVTYQTPSYYTDAEIDEASEW